MTKTRGILFMVWGNLAETLLKRSLASLERWHPDIPIHIHRQETGSLLDKAKMCDISPFDTTLYLDVDTVVMGDISHGFDAAEKHGIACCICECPWARRYGGLKDKESENIREFNTGVLFFNKYTISSVIFDEWKRLASQLDSSILFRVGDKIVTMPENDQASFSDALYDFNPYVLPLNWNFRPAWHKSWFGPIKVYHDYKDPPLYLERWNADQSDPNNIIRYAEAQR